MQTMLLERVFRSLSFGACSGQKACKSSPAASTPAFLPRGGYASTRASVEPAVSGPATCRRRCGARGRLTSSLAPAPRHRKRSSAARAYAHAGFANEASSVLLEPPTREPAPRSPTEDPEVKLLKGVNRVSRPGAQGTRSHQHVAPLVLDSFFLP